MKNIRKVAAISAVILMLKIMFCGLRALNSVKDDSVKIGSD